MVCPDVILIGYDALVSDTAQLQEVEWEVAVLDERDCVPSTLAKAHQALRELSCVQKLLLPPGNPSTVSLMLPATAGKPGVSWLPHFIALVSMHGTYSLKFGGIHHIYSVTCRVHLQCSS